MIVITNLLITEATELGHFSSKSPTLCHKCNSYKYISDVRREADNEYVEDSDDMDTDEIPKGQKKCLSCGHVFVQANNRDANRLPKYQKDTLRNQNEFKKRQI